MQSQAGDGAAVAKVLAARNESEGLKKKERKVKNGIFILPGCEAPPSPVMAGAPRKKLLLPFNNCGDGGQRAAKEAQRGESGAGAVGGEVSPPPRCSVMVALLHAVA